MGFRIRRMKSQNEMLQSELVQAEFVSISSIAVSALVVMQFFQAIFAEPHIHTWQILYCTGLVITYLFALALRRFLDLEVYLFPVYVFLVSAPILIGDHASRPWMSLGLITITANIYFCAFDPWYLGLISMIAFTLFQEWAIYQSPASVSDLPDMKLLGTYFSLTWTLGIGIIGIVIRRNYVRELQNLDEEVQNETLKIIGKLQQISKINRGDFRNLKLHSTTLNTLIYYRNSAKLNENSRGLIKDLDREILDLRNLSGMHSMKLKDAIKQIVQNRVSQRIEIKSISVSGSFENQQMQENFIEILRELLLNLDKHTKATRASITIKVSDSNSFKLSVRENSPYGLPSFEVQRLVGDATKSQSLMRLTEIINGHHSIRLERKGSEIAHDITGGIKNLEFSSQKSLFGVRIRGIENFAMNFARASYFFGLLYVPGYYLLHIRGFELVVLTVHALLANLISFRFRDSKLLLGLLTIVSMAILPTLASGVNSCQDTRYFPWVYNLIMANAFIVSFTVRNIFLRWLPLIVLTFESLFLPIQFPDGCKNIFLGSLPGIPIIAAFAIAFILFKRKVVREDLRGISQVYENKDSLFEIERELEFAYENVLKSLEDFRNKVSKGNATNSVVDREINLEIQRIRSFLAASEQFESKLIREIYAYVLSKYEHGEIIRLSINGKNLFQFDEEFDPKVEISKWNKVLEQSPSEITIVRSDELMVNFMIPGINRSQVKLLTEKLNFGSNRVKYSVQSS